MRGGHNNYVWKKVKRDRAHTEQGGTCIWCTLGIPRKDATLEHMHPRCKGGSDADGNLTAACEACNTLKGPRTAQQFRKLINGRGYNGDIRIDTIRALRRMDKRTTRACKRIRRAAA